MDRDMYAWNTTFPCVTVCPTDKLNMDKLKAFVKWVIIVFSVIFMRIKETILLTLPFLDSYEVLS